jgi:hypothetical protein
MAESDQVVFRVVTGVAAELLVMNFEVCSRAAALASPAVTLQDCIVQFRVLRAIQPDRSGLSEAVHDDWSLLL